jgi:hypothetical protein
VHDQLILDAKSARSIDENGFLHVADCNISKATVNPYWGAEIPNCLELGLDPSRKYWLFRDPTELEKGASTFNSLPVMDKHLELSSFNLEKPEIAAHHVGSTGGNAHFDGQYLVCDISVFKAGAISGIQTGEQRQLSCAYRYDLDMTPGEWQGQPYDGRMFNIRGNHVALVDEGRAGPDVVIRDSKCSLPIDKLIDLLKSNGAKLADLLMDTHTIMDIIQHRKSHKDSKGQPAPWVIVSESTGRVIWSGSSKAAAVAQLRNIEGHK